MVANEASQGREFHKCRSQAELDLRKQRDELKLPRHLQPYSTFIAAMGNHWRPGCLEAVKSMYEHTWASGITCTLAEMPDRCYRPYDSLGTMRNDAYSEALRRGYEYICYVDNDVQPPKEALVTLLQRHVPIVAPLVRYPEGKDWGLTTPTLEQGHGLAMVANVVLSMVLFKTAVFMPWWTGDFWSDSIGADEGYHFEKLASSGHIPFLDTDVVVMAIEPPHFPLDAARGRKYQDFDAIRADQKPENVTGLWKP